ncbi:MAG: hypothetical protein JWL72_434, partial [Ilumatobacteraceae bacterium]|nr:hypothetical protein [Ilumatobacteraceae bacterium]
MPKRLSRLLILAPLLAALIPTAAVHATGVGPDGQGAQIALGPWLTPPDVFDTSGDFATDTFSDPWDMSNTADIN